MSQAQDSATFKTVYKCRNCGNRWDESHGPGTEVTDDWQGVYVRACKELSCSCCGRVECPVCALQDDVTVDDRAPL